MRWRGGERGQEERGLREDALDHRRSEDRGDDRELAAAVRAVLEIDLEHALELPGQADANRPCAKVSSAAPS